MDRRNGYVDVTATPLSADVAYRCDRCGFELWIPIRELSTTVLGLYSDDRFPGRAILSMKQHFGSIEDAPPDDLRDFMTDIKRASSAIRSATSSERVNVAILGNAVQHVHAHLIPRRPSREVYPDRAPWEDPRARAKLAPTDETWWVERIREAFGPEQGASPSSTVGEPAVATDVLSSANTDGSRLFDLVGTGFVFPPGTPG